MRLLMIAALLAFTFTLNGSVTAGTTPRDPTAELYIGWPNDGEVIKKRQIRVWFGLRGMGVAPAGVDVANTGHHHLIIDSDTPPAGMPIPMDERHRHFGGGQTEVSVQLPPGSHTLQLVLADGTHVPHNPAVMSQRVTVTVDP